MEKCDRDLDCMSRSRLVLDLGDFRHKKTSPIHLIHLFHETWTTMTMTTSTTTPAHAIIIPLSAWYIFPLPFSQTSLTVPWHRGHIRPLLHLSLNLLTVHPSLHLTILPSPSSVPLVEREFSSGYLAHIHQVNDNVHERLIDRLQIVHVKPTDPTQANGSGKVDVEDPVAKEATDFATNLPIFLKQLFSPTEGGETFEDKFNAITPSFVIYDVSCLFSYQNHCVEVNNG